MDAQARNKALFRAKLNAQKKERRIDSPLVRYNEFDQPVCRICDVVLKSESNWDAHQASRKHREAIDKLKATAAGRTQTISVRSEPDVVSPKPVESAVEQNVKNDPLTKSSKAHSSRQSLDIFDNQGAEGQKIETSHAEMENDMGGLTGSGVTQKKKIHSQQHVQRSTPVAVTEMESVKKGLPEGFFDKGEVHLPANDTKPARGLAQASRPAAPPETKQAKGAPPEGFFDNKEADLRARGIKPVKIDVKDEYKEFEKLIQEDLQEVDARMEEEEIDAAEMIEEAESLEQKAYGEKVERLRKRKLEFEAARLAKQAKVHCKDSSDEESSSDSDTEGNFAVDWRAQHL
ncbi:hypothetical protein SLE2022_124420 [Rubroshorea leprosula]